MSEHSVRFIDPHLHIWDAQQGHYHWLRNTSNLPLQVSDKGLHCEAYVHIEAGFDNAQPWRELAWLESVATKPMRAIATLDLTLPSEAFVESLAKLAKYPRCVGGRHILDGAAPELLSNPQAIDNLNILAQHGYLFEAQFDAANQEIVERVSYLLHTHSHWRWVINHAGYCVVSSSERQNWRAGMFALSQIPSLVIKCSGFEMQDTQFTWAEVQYVIDQCIEYFGKERVLIASNFPLLTWRMSYSEYWSYLTQVYADRPELYYNNAKRVYFTVT